MFTVKNPVKLLFGEDSFKELGKVAKDLGSKALIVTGRNSARETGILPQAMEMLSEQGVESIPFEKVKSNPLSTTVMEGVDVVKSENCDFVIGIGGGSPMDVAKAITICAKNPGNITDYQPGGKYENNSPEETLPLIEIATTAGTGSEINKIMVITNTETQEKPGIGFDSTYPDVSIVDPKLMVTVPREVTADTGVDVLFHALEAFLGKASNYYSEMVAKEAIRLTVNNLEAAIEDGNDLEARSKMAFASTLAGKAIDMSGTVLIHATGHPLSGHYDITHAKTLSAVSVAYFSNNYDADYDKFATFTKLMGYGEGISDKKELAAKSPEAMEGFLKRIDRNVKISDFVDIDENDIEKLTEDAFKTMDGDIDNNPKPVDFEDIKKIYMDSI